MSYYKALPIIIGVTGHRDIPTESVAALEKHVEEQFSHIHQQYPHCPLVVLSSLADGADRLCARVAIKTGLRLCVPLPMPREEYEKDFDEASVKEFCELLSHADSVFVVDSLEPTSENTPPRGFFYRQAGLYIAKHSHLLLALWDGNETSSVEMGGTYETICFMRQENGIICSVITPRIPSGETDLPDTELWTQKDERLNIIEGFNRDVITHKDKLDDTATQNKPYIVDEDTEKNLDNSLAGLLRTFLYADALSLKFRDLKLLTLRLLSLLGLLLVLSFLLYDEMESDLMLFAYAAIIIAAGVVYALSSRRGYHDKYVLYRALAEALRVQFYWQLGNVTENIYGSYTFAQKSELDFVRFILKSLDIDRSEKCDRYLSGNDCVYRHWVQGQHRYHSSSAVKKGMQNQRNISISKIMLILSILLFIIIAVMELFFKIKAQEQLLTSDSLRRFLIMHEGQAVLWRGILKIALGILSAGTAFLANYYGSLSLSQQIFNNRRMYALFESALLVDPQNEAEFAETLRMLGRESLIESAGWYVMQKENGQKLFI